MFGKKNSDKKISEEKVKEYQKDISNIRKEISRIIVGQERIINRLILGLISNGHILIEGVPGVAKTLVIRALAKITGCKFKRIQFTVDLLPTDIIGITAYSKEKDSFYIIKGPIFANFILADEINRAPPKVQSALLEAMGERQSTIGKKSFPMLNPFFVLATQNPIEVSGTYPLPEAQIDRFLFKLYMHYPNMDEEQKILRKNIEIKKFDDFKLRAVISPEKIIEMQNAAKKIYLSEKIEKYIVNLTNATRNPEKYGIKSGKYIQWGGSPRTSIAMYIASKANALLNGKNFVTPRHVKDIAHDVMKHRIILNYEGMAEGVNTDDIISEILSKVAVS